MSIKYSAKVVLDENEILTKNRNSCIYLQTMVCKTMNCERSFVID